MSEAAPEQRPPAAGGGNVLTRKAGPLPVWAWLALITVAGLGYYLIKGRSSAASPTGSSSTVPASDVPDYVSQTTVNIAEPPDGPPVPSPKPKPKPKGPVSPKGDSHVPPLPGGGKTPQPPVMSNTYTVKAGDTLDKLAEKFGISRVELAHANGLGTGAGLRTGQVLHVPGPVKTRAQGGPG